MSNLYGDWGRALRALRLIPGAIVASTEAQVTDMAKMYLSELKDAIDTQTLSLAPLSEEYFNRKLIEGLDSRILIATHEYVDKLSMKQEGSGKDFKIFVGALAGEMHESSGLDMAQLAKYLNDGTRTMPARPHIQPVWERTQMKIIKTIIDDAIKSFHDIIWM